MSQLPPYAIDILAPPPPVVKGPLTDSSSNDDPTRPTATTHSSSNSASVSTGAGPELVRVVLEEAQLEDSKKWNEERIERRLRGDYERAGRALSDLVRS